MEKFKLAILASGVGSTGEVLFERCVVVVTNNPDAGVIERAKKHGVPVEVMPRKNYQVIGSDGEVDAEKSREKYGEALTQVLRKYGANFISQNGWAILTPANVVETFKDKIVNAHPAPLDPGYLDFGGVGMHGLAVHQAVLNFVHAIKRPFKTEVTLHKVVEEYDKGELLAYTPVPILPEDTPESLQDRAKEAEKKQNEEFWDKLEETGELVTIQRPSRLILPEEIEILEKIKADAIEKYPHG